MEPDHVLTLLLPPLLLVAGPPSTPPLPVAPRPAGAASRPPATPTTLYVNFDGAALQTGCGNDPVENCSTLSSLFGGYVGPFSGNDTQKLAIVHAVRKRLADVGVRVVTERPAPSEEYSMVLYGDLGEQGFAGIAPYIDCEDTHPRDTSFSQGFDTSNTGATVILQEAAHTWGLEHVDGEGDVMHPFVVSGNTQVFQDVCHPIVANTDLDPAPGVCNVVHTLFCPPGRQNSLRELLHLFGPAIPDTAPPVVYVIDPPDGAEFGPEDDGIPLVLYVDDDTHPQVYEVEVHVNGELALASDLGTMSHLLTAANFTDPPPGRYAIRLVVRDLAGNAAEAQVTITVAADADPKLGTGGAGLPDAGFSAEEGCRVHGGAPAAPWFSFLVPLFARRKTR